MGRVQHSCRGKGTPFPGSTQGTVQKRGTQLGFGGSLLCLPEVGRDSVELRAKGALPPQPHPLLLIKAKNKEAAGEGGFDLTPPSQF